MTRYHLAKFLYAIFRLSFHYSLNTNKLAKISRNCVKLSRVNWPHFQIASLRLIYHQCQMRGITISFLLKSRYKRDFFCLIRQAILLFETFEISDNVLLSAKFWGFVMKYLHSIVLSLASLTTLAPWQSSFAAVTPANQNQLRIHTSLPKKQGDSLFSYTAEWRQNGGKLYHSTGMSFLDANKQDPETGASKIAKKLASSIKESMIQLDPNWRGINVDQTDEQAEFIISNKSGYALTSVVMRDYTNQALSFDLMGKRFNTESVQIAFDLVLAADVEYLDKFSAQKPKTAGHGSIEISIDEQKPVSIKTDGKTTREIESEITHQLAGSQLGDTTLVTSQIGKDTRNIKPFDGAEVQLLNAAAKTVHIDINDPSLGVLVKFKVKDTEATVSSESNNFGYILAVLLILLAGAFWYQKKSRQNS